MLLPQGGYNRPALQIPCLPFGKARCTLALLYDERSSSKSTRRKNPCAMHTAPGGAKRIMLLRRMQVAIPLEDQSKLFSMNVLRKAPLCRKPRYCAILGHFVRIRTASVVQETEHFSLFGRQVFARDSARRSRLRVHPASIPARYRAAWAVVFITRARIVCFVLPFCSAKVTVVRTSNMGLPSAPRAALVKTSLSGSTI